MRNALLRAFSLLCMASFKASGSDLRLIDAIQNQNLEQVSSLLTQHVDVNARSGEGSTALLWAAHWDAVETADLLIRAGADPNAANDFQMNPLSQACTNGSAALVGLLFKACANATTRIAT